MHLHADAVNLDSSGKHACCHIDDSGSFATIIVGNRDVVIVVEEKDIWIGLSGIREGLVDVVGHHWIPGKGLLQVPSFFFRMLVCLVDNVPSNNGRRSHTRLHALHNCGNVVLHDTVELDFIKVTIIEPVRVVVSPDEVVAAE